MNKKVFWTQAEEDKLFEAFAKVFKQDPKASATKAAALAQLVLPQERHRKIITIRAVPERLRARLQMAGLINHLTGMGQEEVSKDQLRINQLAEERDQALEMMGRAEQERDSLKAEVVTLRTQLAGVPKETEVIKAFLADILGRAMKQSATGITPTFSQDANDAQKREQERQAQAAAAAERKRIEAEEATRRTLHAKPEILVVVGSEVEAEFVGRLQQGLPDVTLREVRARADGHLQHLPKGAKAAVLIAGVRHATSAEVREVYPGAPLCAKVEAANLLSATAKRVRT